MSTSYWIDCVPTVTTSWALATDRKKQLWAGSVQGQIAKMRELYDLLPEKPEWLTLDDISKYAQRMESGGVLSPAETAATPRIARQIMPWRSRWTVNGKIPNGKGS